MHDHEYSTYPVFEDKAPTAIAELAMYDRSRAIFSNMLLRRASQERKRILRDLCRQAIVRSKGFLRRGLRRCSRAIEGYGTNFTVLAMANRCSCFFRRVKCHLVGNGAAVA